GEVEAADAVVRHLHAVRQQAPVQPGDDLYPEAVVTEEDVADARHEDLHSGSTSERRKKKRWPGWRISPRSRPGSSSITTATWTSSSKSRSTASTVAVRPASTRSMMSAPPRGRRRTLSPTLSSLTARPDP